MNCPYCREALYANCVHHCGEPPHVHRVELVDRLDLVERIAGGACEHPETEHEPMGGTPEALWCKNCGAILPPGEVTWLEPRRAVALGSTLRKPYTTPTLTRLGRHSYRL